MASHVELTNYINSLSPSAYWRLDETSGSSFDQTGTSTAAAMTIVGDVQPAAQPLIPGDSTGFPIFNPGSYATASRGNVSVPFADVSVSLLVYWTPPVVNGVRLLSVGTSGETTATNFQLLTQIRSDNRLSDFVEYGSGTDQDIVTNQDLDIRYRQPRVLLFTMVRNSTSRVTSFYVNGKLWDTVSYDNSPTGGTSTVFMLSNNTAIGNPASVQSSSMGHVCFFNRQLTSSEVYDMAVAAGVEDGELGYLRFRQAALSGPDLEFLSPATFKVLIAAIDPLIDSGIAFPDDAYTTQE
jgi:hypothetical protein